MEDALRPPQSPVTAAYTREAGIPGVDEEVRLFYDLHPYPPPVDSLDGYRRLWNDHNRRRADFHLLWPTQPYRDERSILVAGCGTSQAAKYAVRHPAAHVVGIDLSAESVRHTLELKHRYKLANLDVHQLPIERAAQLAKRFDQIVCTGVLHHLPDPAAGLRALRELLAPGGAMHVMVYASYGRTGIYMMQEYCRRLGIRYSEEEIHDLASTLQALPPGHPVERILREAADFRQRVALADAFLHPRDRAYTVPQFFDFAESSGMAFGRWLRQAPYLPQCGAPANTPHFARLLQLPVRERYAATELFRGTMLRHSAILYRDDEPTGAGAIRFDGEGWLGYRPIRMPNTIAVRERLPRDAAAILINQAHTYPDLLLPVDPEQLGWFSAIDGSCAIAEIVGDFSAHPEGEQRLARARDFFERLWWYDQVVFDASPRPAVPPASREQGVPSG
jgi:SAM-dependent methyltransferase